MSETQEVVVRGEPLAQRRQKEAEPMKSYKLREGAKHFMPGEDGTLEAVGPDEEVGLTDREYIAFADKFVPTGKSASAKRSGKLAKGVEDTEPFRAGAEKLNPPPPRPMGVDHLPQDIGGKTPDLAAPAANPGNLTRMRGAGGYVAGGVPVSAESLQSAGEPVKGEDKPGQDGPVQPGQIQPERNVAAATVAGGVATAIQQQTEPAKAKSDKK